MEGIKHDKMKYRLAEAMKNCMKKMPVEKITVKEIKTAFRQKYKKYILSGCCFAYKIIIIV